MVAVAPFLEQRGQRAGQVVRRAQNTALRADLECRQQEGVDAREDVDIIADGAG